MSRSAEVGLKVSTLVRRCEIDSGGLILPTVKLQGVEVIKLTHQNNEIICATTFTKASTFGVACSLSFFTEIAKRMEVVFVEICSLKHVV
jgi:hypothetical protein